MAKATIPIYHNDDFERLAELRINLAIAERRYETAKAEAAMSQGSALRMGDDDPDDVAEKHEALESERRAFNAFVDEATERAEMWVLQPIGHEEFRDLLKAHPPRKIMSGEGDEAKEVTHPDDEGWEINSETFPKALLLFVDPDDDELRTVVEPEFDTEAALRKRVKRLSEGEFTSMWTTAYAANKGGVRDLKAVRF